MRVFLTEDERVLVYDGHRSRYYQLENPAEQLRGWFGNKPALYAEALEALGEKPIIDL